MGADKGYPILVEGECLVSVGGRGFSEGTLSWALRVWDDEARCRGCLSDMTVSLGH